VIWITLSKISEHKADVRVNLERRALELASRDNKLSEIDIGVRALFAYVLIVVFGDLRHQIGNGRSHILTIVEIVCI